MTLLGFLAGYRGFTRDGYALDLRQFTAWCWQHDHRLFDVRRIDIECSARDLEERGKARATVARRLCTIVGFYRYAEEEGVIEHSPAVHIRRPRIDYESHVAHLDRNELGAILVTAGLSSPRDHALVSLLALNGLRVSEAIGANHLRASNATGHALSGVPGIETTTGTWNAALPQIAGQDLPKAHLAERDTSGHPLAASVQGLVSCSLSRVGIRPDGSDDAFARRAVHHVAHPAKAG
jgi:hypothetical protein